jgi:methylthioribose-1-phosphate isomerase
MSKQLDVVKLNETGDAVIILDQTKLPNHEEYLTLTKEPEMWQAIKLLQVRGAPAIGVFAGYAMAVLAQALKELPYDAFKEKFDALADHLNTSRPTAVNLSWALNRMKKFVSDHQEDTEKLAADLIKEAETINAENLAMNQKIAAYGVTLLHEGDGILTHCNAGYLACLGYGTATAPMYLAHEKGMHIHVYSDETRPLLQGARLTSYELYKAGIDVTSICDNMASLVMKQGKIQCVMVGCDRIAANGDFANKIGTSGAAILAKYYGIPFYTLGPSSTIDLNTPTGKEIKIEMRDPEEVGEMWYKEPMILKEIKKFNPSFDVTDHELVSGIVTEKGIVYPPFQENLKKLFCK